MPSIKAAMPMAPEPQKAPHFVGPSSEKTLRATAKKRRPTTSNASEATNFRALIEEIDKHAYEAGFM
jgi:hypothetical protein